jgi:hypothetical protein
MNIEIFLLSSHVTYVIVACIFFQFNILLIDLWELIPSY